MKRTRFVCVLFAAMVLSTLAALAGGFPAAGERALILARNQGCATSEVRAIVGWPTAQDVVDLRRCVVGQVHFDVTWTQAHYDAFEAALAAPVAPIEGVNVKPIVWSDCDDCIEQLNGECDRSCRNWTPYRPGEPNPCGPTGPYYCPDMEVYYEGQPFGQCSCRCPADGMTSLRRYGFCFEFKPAW